jgi:ribonuclease Y
MNGVWYAAIGVAFVLGLLFVRAYGTRSRGAGSGPVAANGRGTDRAAAPTSAADDAAESARRVAEAEVASLRQVARSEIDALRRAARTEAEATRRAARAELQEQTRRLEESEARLEAEAARLARETAELDTALRRIDEQRGELDAAVAEAASRRAALEQRAAEHEQALERVAGLSVEQAKAELLAGVEATARRDAAVLVRTIENEARSEGTERARAIVVEAVQRVASEQTAETVVSVLHLPSDEMKGRIIGREGRNIRAFESVTGVNVIIDDTPEAVLLSCFDPVRREIGRLTLDRLVLDGRIHPHRIEEAYEQSKQDVDALCLRAARDALADVGVGAIDERLMPTLGRLKYRTSYGQNVLGHLVETAHIAGVMAAELGIEPTLVKRCAFLHDIGKALTHEVEGSHAIVGAELLRRYGEDEAVVHAVEAHHNEVQPRTIEAVLTQASDTCSAARPGARRESLEAYVKRLRRIEEIANAKPGVEKVFAMQSGREVRVMVVPSEVDDLAAQVIAREIAKQVEDELTYPGQIRVTVVRESRAIEIAH